MDEIIVLQYNTRKVKLDEVKERFSALSEAISIFGGDYSVIALPDGMSLITSSMEELEEVQRGINNILCNNYEGCDWCERGANDLVEFVDPSYSCDIQEYGWMHVYKDDEPIGGRKVRFCPMCGRKLGK